METLSRSQRVSNSRFKVATGWEPNVRDARVGMPLLVRSDAERAQETAPSAAPERLAARK